MPTKHIIPIEGLPDGWKLKELRIRCHQEADKINPRHPDYQPYTQVARLNAEVILEKIQPRRIVLEETGEYRKPNNGEWVLRSDDHFHKNHDDQFISEYHIWREVKEE